MTVEAITALITRARERHLWLRSVTHPDLWLAPAEVEAIGVEVLATVHPGDFVLADRMDALREIALKRQKEKADSV